jgi:hypothetical protein
VVKTTTISRSRSKRGAERGCAHGFGSACPSSSLSFFDHSRFRIPALRKTTALSSICISEQPTGGPGSRGIVYSPLDISFHVLNS